MSGGGVAVGPGMVSPQQAMFIQQQMGGSRTFAQQGPGGVLQGPLAYLEKTTSNIGELFVKMVLWHVVRERIMSKKECCDGIKGFLVLATAVNVVFLNNKDIVLILERRMWRNRKKGMWVETKMVPFYGKYVFL